MKELTRFEMAVIKRTAANTKSLRTKRDKLVARIEASQAELETINIMIDKFEQPIKEMTGGYTSEEVLNGVTEEVQCENEMVEAVPSIQPEVTDVEDLFPTLGETKEESTEISQEEFNV